MNWLKKILKDYKTMRLNKKVFETFVRETKEELTSEEPTLMQQYKLSVSDDRRSLSTIIILPEEFSRYPDERVIQLKLNDYTRPINNYFWYDMNWLEIMGSPQIYHLEDEETSGIREGEKFSLSFLAVWTFKEQPYEHKNWHKVYNWLRIGFWSMASMITAGLMWLGLLFL